MPVHVEKVDGKYRVVEVATGHIAKNAAGTAVDGSGHTDATKAEAQARAINASLHREGKI